MTKILIATGIFPPQIGGPATYSKLLLDKLPARGFEVEIVNFGDVIGLPKVLRHTVYFFKVLWHSAGADIIYAQDPVSVGLPAMFVAKLLRKKFYLKIVGDYAWEQGVLRAGMTDTLDIFSREYAKYPLLVRFLKRVEYRVAMKADKVITPSEYLKKIVMNWGISPEKVTVIYNGFDAPVITESKDALREKLGISGHAILSVGRLVPWKGFEMLIEMMHGLTKEIPDAHLFVIGEGPDKNSLEKKIAEFGLGDRVTLVGKLPQEKLFEYIKASDVFVLNTAYEGFSHQLLEVMALGTPIITTPVGGNIEIIEDNKNGLLVVYNDKLGFEKSILRLHSDKTLVQVFSHNAQGDVKEFSDIRMLDAITRELV